MGKAEGSDAQWKPEGKQVMRVPARNMVSLIESVALGEMELGIPAPEEPRVWTNFIC